MIFYKIDKKETEKGIKKKVERADCTLDAAIRQGNWHAEQNRMCIEGQQRKERSCV